MKLWGGRFKKDTDALMEEFNSSINFDSRLFKQDIRGSIAHAKTLNKAGILTDDETDQIICGLNGILKDILEGKIVLKDKKYVKNEDIHMNIEVLLTERIGEAGKKLHTARSRNDQVALDMKLYIRDEVDAIIDLIKSLINEIAKIASNHIDTIMPAYTHMQRAQPTSLAHHLTSYCMMLIRDNERLKDLRRRMNVSPLGSGAVTGVPYDLDREYTAKLLNFDGVTLNSIDGVSDRDYLIEFLSASSIMMMHLSRFSEEIVIWNTAEFNFIELDDSYSTGSSMMPQKKNPDAAELIRGKTGRVYGNLVTLLTVMKALPLAYNKDMQEDKEAVFDTIDTVKRSLSIFKSMIATAEFNRIRLREVCKKGYLNATDLADYLAGKGIPFRKAHEIAGRIVRYAIDNNLTLEEIKIDKFREFCVKFEEDVYTAIDINSCIDKRKVIGGSAKEAVLYTLNRIKEYTK